MSPSPLVSVIIPCYNVKEYIIPTLNSLYNQSYDNFEIIVVDDASNDGTTEILKRNIGKEKLTIAFEKENKGVAVSRNIGISIARGKYITFLDADDEYDINFILDGVNALDNSNRQLYCCSFEKVGLKRKNYSIDGCYNNVDMSGLELLELILSKKIHQHICAMMVSSELIKDNNIVFNSKLSYSEDFLFIVTLLMKTKYVYYSNVALFKYNIRNNSAMRGGFSEKRKDTLRALNIINAMISNLNDNDNDKIKNIFPVYAGITKIYLLKLAVKSMCSYDLLIEIITFKLPIISIGSVCCYNRKYKFFAFISYVIEVFNARKK